MAAIRIYRRLQELQDVDPNGLPDKGVPVYQTNVSSFVVAVPATAGAFSMGVTDSGNTLGDTGVTGPRIGLVGSGNLTLVQSTDFNGGTITISAGTAAGAGFSAGISGGNTAGDTGVTGTRLVLAGGSNVTLSGATDANGGTVTIVGPATVAQSVQTQHLFDMTLDGNTAGALALVSSGTLTLVGGNSITLSQNGNAITILGASTSQSVQTQPIQTGISSIVASNATYTSGSVQFTGSGIVTIRSSANQRVVVDASQSVQTQNMVDVTISGNTAGAGALVSSGTLSLAGGSNITLSQNGNAISIIGNAAGTETQVAISGIANSQTTYTSGTVSLSELGAITIRSTTGNQFQLSVNPQSVQPETQTFVGGIAASNTTYTSGTITLTGVGGGVTVSSNTGQRVDISVAAQSAESQSIGMSNIGNTSGTTGIASGAQVRMLFAGGNSITLSQSLNGASGTITISGPTISESIGMSNLGNTSGTTGIASGPQVRYLLAGGNNVTLSQSLNGASGTLTISAASQTVQTQNVHNVTLSGNTSGVMAQVSSGTMTLAGGNNITLSQAGNAITISGANVGGAQTGISGIIASDATYTSGTVEFTGSNMITVKSSAGQRVVIDATQSVQSVGMYAVGNTTGQSSSTTRDARSISVDGAGIISVGYSGGTLRISATQSVQPETQTFIGGVANTETTYTSGTVKLLELGAITVRSTTGNQFQLSVNAQTGTQFSAGISGGNTAGDTGTVAGRVVLAGGNNVTLSGSTNGASETITIVGPTTQAFSAGVSNLGNSAGATGVSGTRLVLVGSNNITLSQTTGAAGATVSVFGSSGTGSDSDVTAITQTGHGLAVGDWVRLSGTSYVKAQADSEANAEVVGVVSAVADADNFTLTTGGLVTGLSGLTAGAVYYLDPSTAGAITSTEPSTTGQISKPVFIARTTTSGYVFNMRGNIVPASAITAFLAGMSNIGNTSGDTGITGSRLVLAGGNNITLSQSTNASGGTVTISAGAGGGFSGGVSNVGNTSGDTGITGSRLVLAGTNGITLSQSTNASGGTVTISGITQSVESQSFGMSNIGNTSGTTGIASGGQVRFLLAGGNNITLSQSLNGASGTITISAPNAVAQTVQSLGMYAVQNTTGQSSSTTMDARTLSIAGDGAVSVGYSAGSLRISAPVQTVESQSIGMSNVGNTSGTTGVASGAQVRFVLAGGNNVTLSQSLNGASGTLTISAFNQSVQSLGMYAVQNTTGQSSSTTMDARTLSVAGDGAVSVGYSAGSLRISAPVQTGTQFSGGISGGNTSGDTGTVGGRLVFAGGNNVTLSGSTNGASETITISAFNQTVESQSIGMSNIGNTSGTTGIASGGQVRFVFAGGNNITLSQSLNGASGTITISAPNLGAGAMSVGVSTGGNTAGSTGVTGTRLVLVGTNNISLSQSTDANGGTVSFNNTVSAFQAGVSTGGNTAGDTGVTGTRLVLVGSSPVSLSQATGANGGTITINAPATSSLVGASGISISTNGSTISIMQTTGSSLATSFAPYDDSPMVTGQQGNGTLHIQPIRVPDLQMDRIVIAMQISNATNSSGSFTLSQWAGIYTRNVSTISLVSSTSVSTNFTMSGTAGSYSRIGGPRALTIPWTMTLTDNDYYVGLVSRTTSGGADVSVSALLLSKFTNVDWSGILGTASNASDQRLLGLGIRSATTSGIPASIAFTDLRGTGSIVLRSPVFQLRSGTV